MKTLMQHAIVLVLCGTWLSEALAEEPKGLNKEPVCPMVEKRQDSGLFELVEVYDSKGNRGVAEPGETVTIKCTIVNLTKRDVMVAEDFVTPESGDMVAMLHSEKLEVADPDGGEPTITWYETPLEPVELDIPKAIVDWGHVRRWIHVAASRDVTCGCSIRHRMYSRTLKVVVPKGEWTTVEVNLSQKMPAILLGPEEHVTFRSELQLSIKRRSEQDGADQPATAPESTAEGKEETKPESEVRPR